MVHSHILMSKFECNQHGYGVSNVVMVFKILTSHYQLFDESRMKLCTVVQMHMRFLSDMGEFMNQIPSSTKNLKHKVVHF